MSFNPAPSREAMCPNCGHEHHDRRCAGKCDDGASCVCSWPDPSNFDA